MKQVNAAGQVTVRSLTPHPAQPVRTIERLNPSSRVEETRDRMVTLYKNAEVWRTEETYSLRIEGVDRRPVQTN